MSDAPTLRLMSGSVVLPEEVAELQYLPHGITTLKLRFDPPADCPPGPLIAAPRARHQDPTRVVVGHEDDGRTLWVTWGGGKPGGIHFDPARGMRYLYFTILHRGEVLAEEFPLTIEVRDEAGNVVGARRFTLYRPHARHPIRLNWHNDWPYGSTLHWQGKQVPRYQPRWWPEQRIEHDTREVPRFVIRYDRITTSDKWGRVVLTLDGERLVKVDGRLETALHDLRLFNANLFHFYEDVWAVRLWFSWLHTSFIADDLPLELWGSATPPARDSQEEIPDIERFDVLVDVRKKQVLFVGTDNHYRELWGEWTEPRQVQARIGHNMSRHTVLFIVSQQINNALISLSTSRDAAYNPATVIREQLMYGSRPLPFDEVREAISWEAHAPVVDDLRVPEALVSGDIRFMAQQNEG